MKAHWLKDIGRWYCIQITFEPFLQNCFFLLVCQVAEKFLKFRGRYFGRKWTKTIFLAQKGLIKIGNTFRIEGMVERKFQLQNDRLYSEIDKTL